ncbi:GNAT family N-acetyltransferase [Sphingobium sp. CR2-8]|uniref:GNAT family N-acetyltransferase n=1 Tax=Sphingobium sp. CR2-8 TaxID=1306534 RepID=UPI002DB76840|nr:GNAT family N-acetyltransferase [Sphingobium sp. CR2-8]MEC3909145.1 GNAT family N-acetyltransferase [Sphingobium sp. CR2-8]
MSHSIALHDARHDALWDDLIGRSNGGTVMHSRRFLAYHGDRFQDESLCVWREADVRLQAVLPLARSPVEADVAVSHPGSTFGGLIEDRIDPATRAGLLSDIARLLLDRGYRRMIYKSVPAIFGGQFDESDLRLLMRVGTVRRSDLWNFVRLEQDHRMSPKRRASITAAARKGVAVRQTESEADWIAFHNLLSANLASRHDAVPVHSLADMLSLRDRIVGENALWLAIGPDGDMIAGTWYIAYNHRAVHTQYIASNERGRAMGAVDYLLSAVMEQAKADGCRVFSFGINSLSDGYGVNTGLLKQKLRFGAGVCVHWHFDVDLALLARVDAGFA